jgi:hypothetical protein
MIHSQILEVTSTDDMRVLQGEGRRIKKILAMFDRRPLQEG